MTTTLRVFVDSLASAPGAQTPSGRYARELTRAIIATSPRNCDVEGIVGALNDERADAVLGLLPGLRGLRRSSLASRELAIAWQLGVVGSSGSGLVHSPALLAPLRKHQRDRGDQISLTVHDVLAWTHPHWIGTAAVAADKALMRQARKHADAVVVPSHALAAELAEIVDLGDRIRVIPGDGRSGLTLTSDAVDRAAALNLPTSFILASGSLHPRDGISPLVAGLDRIDLDLPLLILDAHAPVPSSDVEKPAAASGLVRYLGHLDDADRAVVLSRAIAFVFPALEAGFGAPIVDALRFGLPVIHSDAPALVELSGEATVVVERDERGTYADRLAAAVSALVEDEQRMRHLAVVGSDRARLFSWRDAGERIWQLHADL